MNPTGMLVAVPAFGARCEMDTVESLVGLSQGLAHLQIPMSFTWQSAADIVLVRNTILTIWYEARPECSHLLFVDADMWFPPVLIRDMLAFDQPLMGVMYAQRQIPPRMVGCVYKDKTTKDIVNGFLEVDGVGGGVMMIHRDVVTAMIEKCPEIVITSEPAMKGHPSAEAFDAYKCKRILTPFEKIMTDTGLPLSEDFSFCKRWQRCGGKVWANVDHYIGHWGRIDYGVKYREVMEAAENETALKEAAE